jgi:hypothetical protein
VSSVPSVAPFLRLVLWFNENARKEFNHGFHG